MSTSTKSGSESEKLLMCPISTCPSTSNPTCISTTTTTTFRYFKVSTLRPKFFTCILIFSLVMNQGQFSYGGNCWLTMNKNGLCSALVKTGATKEECCNSNESYNSVSVSYSEGGDLSPSLVFYMHLQGGVKCQRCRESCSGVKCPENQKCAMRNGVPKCICAPNCLAFRLKNASSHHRGPVCGSDNRTYKSSCRLLKRNCRRKVNNTIAYYGTCKMSCSTLSCPAKKRCLLDQNMIPHCVNCSDRKCSPSTGKSSSPHKAVCGVDGLSYPSICHLRQSACQRGFATPLAYRGPCKKKATCDNVQCSDSQTCLVELFTGKPRCTTCLQPKWCKANQSQNAGPLCANNNHTYRDYCSLLEYQCNTGIALTTKHFGRCRKDT